MKVYVYAFLTVLFLGIGFFAGWTVKPSPKPETIEIIKNIDKPVYKTVYVPQTPAEWNKWAESPIIIDRKLIGNIYNIRATDGYKETKVSDRIEIGSTGDWKLYVGVGSVCAAAGIAGASMLYAVIR